MNEQYKGLSSNSKILYSLFLNRTKFSKKNYKKFCDKNGAFIYYSNSQIQKHLNCSSRTATNTLIELERAGLIKKEYQGNGLPLKIYVTDIRGDEDATHTASESAQDKLYKKSYSNSIHKEKPATRQNKTEDRGVSFDVERAEMKARNTLYDFSIKKKRRTRNPGPTL